MIYKRILTWICYISFIITICILFIITDAYWLFMLIPLLLLLPLLSFCLLILQKYIVQIRLTKRNGQIWIQIDDHHSIFGHPLIELQIKEYNAFTKEERIQTVSLFNDLIYPSEHFAPGMIYLSIQRVRYLDILHLFSLQERKNNVKITFLQLPQEVHFSANNVLHTYTTSKREDAWQDKHEVREYRPGDAFKWIHHKLSYKSGKLMVREFENASYSTMHLLLDLSGSLMQCKETLSLYQGIAKALLTDNTHLQIIYYSEQREQMIELQQIEDVTSSLNQILSQPKSTMHIFPFQVKEIQQGIYAVEQGGADHNDTMAL